MANMKKWEQFKKHSNSARDFYITAEFYARLGYRVAAAKNMHEHWYQLLLAAEANYSPPRTEKQQRQQKLWQQRGLLERTRANLRAVQKDCTYSGEIAAINNVVAIVENLIRRNQQQMITL